MITPDIDTIIKDVESRHFRTSEDTGAHPCAMVVWNSVRAHVGLTALTKETLPAFCLTHKQYHRIYKEYGCVRAPVKDMEK